MHKYYNNMFYSWNTIWISIIFSNITTNLYATAKTKIENKAKLYI